METDDRLSEESYSLKGWKVRASVIMFKGQQIRNASRHFLILCWLNLAPAQGLLVTSTANTRIGEAFRSRGSAPFANR
jgi:hypothetical protein